MLEPLKPEIIAEIERILTGVKSGELEHNQVHIHCETAHCIAGWHQVLKYEKLGICYKKVEIDVYIDYNFVNENNKLVAAPDAWDEAREDWDLTHTEANILFSQDATLDYQFCLLNWFKLGKRLPDYVVDKSFEPDPKIGYTWTGGLSGFHLEVYSNSQEELNSVETEICEDFVEFCNTQLSH